MAPQAPRAVREPVTFFIKKEKDHDSGVISNLPASTHLRSPSPISNLQRHILPVRSPISDLHLQSPISSVRSPISVSNLQSPISIRGGGGGGRARTFKEMRYGFIHTAHLRSPISNLPFDPCRRQLRSPISNLDLQSPPQRWMPGARIYDLCSPSPISTFDPGNCQHDPQSVISIFHLQPSPTVW